MTGPGEGDAEPFWRRRKVQALALVLVLLVAWLVSYLENLPVSREARKPEALTVARDEAVRLDGIAAGEPVTVRTTAGTERLVVTLPGDARMRAPDEQAFRAKAKEEAAELAGIAYGKSTVVDVHPGQAESAAMQLAFGDGRRPGTLQWHRLSDSGNLAWKVTVVGAPARLTLDLDTPAAAPAGTMLLSRPDATARVGEAEFDLEPGSTVKLEVLGHAGGSGPAAVVQLPGEASVLLLRAVELGTPTDPGELDVFKIACAAGTRRYLWSSLLSTVSPGNCEPHRLAVSAFDLQTGEVSIGRRAFFQGFGDSDTASLITKLKANLVFSYLLGAIATGVAVPWVMRQFSKKKTTRSRTPRSKPGGRKG